MSEINYQALREAAEKAGEDKWQAKKINGDFFVIRHGSYTRQHGYTSYQPIAEIDCKPVRDFVAKANPATVLALLDELEAAEKRIAELEPLAAPKLTQQAVMHDAATAIRACLDDFPEGVRDIVEECAAIAENACRADKSSPAYVPDEMTPKMMRAVQLYSELGAYATANMSGAYGLFSEFWKVACRAAIPQCSEPETDNTNQQFESLSRGDK